MKHLLLIFIFTLSHLIHAQKTLSTTKQLKEYEVIETTLKSHFIGLDYYRTSEEVDSIFNDLRIQLMQPLAYKELYQTYASFLANFDDGHTQMQPSDKLINDFLYGENTLPFSIGVDDSSFYASEYHYSSVLEIYNNDRILTINGKNAKEYFQEMSKRTSTDGKNTTFSKRLFQSHFQYYYFLNYPTPEYFTIRYLHKEDTLERVVFPSTPSFNVINSLYAQGNAQTKKDYGHLFINRHHKFAYLKYESFFNSSGFEYKLKLQEHFEKINDARCEYLIIDLRDNLGGKFQMDLMGHLFEHSTPICKVEFNAMEKPKYRRHMQKNNMYNLYNRLRLAAQFKPDISSEKYYTKYKSDIFKGKIIILMNGNTFSASTNVATILKHKRNALLIGETSGGNPNKSCTGLIDLKLPHSKFSMVVNPFFFEHQIDSIPNNALNGLDPHLEMPYYITSGKDDVLQKAIEIIIYERENDLNIPSNKKKKEESTEEDDSTETEIKATENAKEAQEIGDALEKEEDEAPVNVEETDE